MISPNSGLFSYLLVMLMLREKGVIVVKQSVFVLFKVSDSNTCCLSNAPNCQGFLSVQDWLMGCKNDNYTGYSNSDAALDRTVFDAY